MGFGMCLVKCASKLLLSPIGEKPRQTLSFPPGPARSSPRVTELLTAWREGDSSALDELVPLVEAELRRLARGYLRRERPGHVLQTTALMNEAFVRLLNWQGVSWQNRAHFLAMAARLMRHILVDMSRRRAKGRRWDRYLDRRSRGGRACGARAVPRFGGA